MEKARRALRGTVPWAMIALYRKDHPAMKHRFPSRFAATAATTIAALFCLAAAPPASAGVHLQAVTRTTDARSRTHEMQIESWVMGDKARVEFRVSDDPIARPGTYVVTKDAGKTLYWIDPEAKTYAVWNLDAMMGFVGGILNGAGPALKVEFSAPKVERLSDDDGGTIAGIPTRHIRYRTTYSMKVKVLGFGRATDVESDQDLWVADRLRDRALGLWLRGDPPRTGNEQFDTLVAAGHEKLAGFPLKSITVDTRTQKEKQTVTRSTMEVTELKSTSVPDSRFEIPEGFKEQPMPAVGRAPGGDK
jgi:hypothetical protein